MTKPSRWLIVAGLLTIYLVWGSTYLAIRVAVETLPPFLMAGARFLVAGSLVAAILLVTQKFRATYAQWVWNAGVGCLMLLGGNGLVSWLSKPFLRNCHAYRFLQSADDGLCRMVYVSSYQWKQRG